MKPRKEPNEIEIVPTDVFIHPDYDQDDSYARGDLGFVQIIVRSSLDFVNI